ncbi:MAG: dynamin family protein [Proteobacteria bacterium]|nr:dynamin family protein [Pseudomonadota bacterium]MCL2307880.1 dynamin family protein [Pseudomonadota bacterium]
MDTPRPLATQFEAYSRWRQHLSAAVGGLHQWLKAQNLADIQTAQTITQIRTRLNEDKLVLAFVAEFSRGKSELINAVFFSGYGQRLLPSTAGRTTMCPTELLYDPALQPSLRLLPIETRLQRTSVTDLKNVPQEWVTVPLDITNADQMSQVLQRVSQVKFVPLDLANQYGFFDNEKDIAAAIKNHSGEVEIPCWRHAIINFPHPMLEQGLIILDTPGLNAIGTEPELTLSLLPSAHGVLFILAADAGVTKTDLDVWQQYLVSSDPASKSGHIVVLNKIDGLWDELKTPQAVEEELASQVESTANILDIPASQIFPLSAQKGLLAKVNGDQALLARSRLPELERALTERIIPTRREIVGDTTRADVHALILNARAILDTREDSISEQLDQLLTLRNKNQDVVLRLLDQTKEEKIKFEHGMARYTAMRRIFTNLTNALLDAAGTEALRLNANRTHLALEASSQTRSVRSAINHFFTSINEDMAQAEFQAKEIHDMVSAMSSQFSKELRMKPFAPTRFSLEKYKKELSRLHSAYQQRFEALWGSTTRARLQPMQRFFEAIVTRAKHIYGVANRDAESWLKGVMIPLETQIRERHQQLRKRQDRARQMSLVSSEAEGHSRELREQFAEVQRQQNELDKFVTYIDALMSQQDFSEEPPPFDVVIPMPREAPPVPPPPEIDSDQFDVATIWPTTQNPSGKKR